MVLTVRTDDPAYDEVSEYVAELGKSAPRHAGRADPSRAGGRGCPGFERPRPPGSPGRRTVQRITEISAGCLCWWRSWWPRHASPRRLADRLLGHRLRHLSTTARSAVDAAARGSGRTASQIWAAVVDLSPEDFDDGLAAAVLAGVLVRRLRPGGVPARAAPRGRRCRGAAPYPGEQDAPRVGGANRASRPRTPRGGRRGPALDGRRPARPGVSCLAGGRHQGRADLWLTPSRCACSARRPACRSRLPEGARPADTDLAAILTAAAQAGMLGLGRQEASQAARRGHGGPPSDAPAARRAWLDIQWDLTLWRQDGPLSRGAGRRDGRRHPDRSSQPRAGLRLLGRRGVPARRPGGQGASPRRGSGAGGAVHRGHRSAGADDGHDGPGRVRPRRRHASHRDRSEAPSGSPTGRVTSTHAHRPSTCWRPRCGSPANTVPRLPPRDRAARRAPRR